MDTQKNNTPRDLHELQLLYDISTLLADTIDVKTVLRPVMETIARYMGIIRGVITILNRAKSEIAIEEAWGYENSEIQLGHYRPGEGIIGRVINTGNPIAIPRIAEEPLFLDKTGARRGVNTYTISFICVPIKTSTEVIGALAIDIPYRSDREHNENFLDGHVRILSIIASTISQAVRLRQITQEEIEKLKEENDRLHAELTTKFHPQSVVGNSKIMRLLYDQIEQVSATNATVLLLGESGVGKERIAHAIHYSSPRSEKPFVKLNCAAIPESLIESELFGHEKGSFTNAVGTRKGRFELANGGTIFLDEIGEMPLAIQSKFLRVLQEREFERVGGSETIKVNIRIIAATNRELPELIREGNFREDLYYRLNVFPLIVPPLRERKTDIMLLSDFFIEKYAKEHGKKIRNISTPAINLMMSYNWPGNVRELENCIERAVILNTDETIHSYQLPPSLQTQTAKAAQKKTGTLTEVMEALEREILLEELRKTDGNLSKAAQNLGITERIMGLRVSKYKLKPKGDNYVNE